MAGPAGGTNPIKVIDDNPMSARQWIVVAIMVFLNALDGFDVLSSAFAAPGITEEWGIPRSELGVMLSAELVGMGFGSVILGGFADKAGRKLAMLVCLVIMAIGMYMAHDAGDPPRAPCQFFGRLVPRRAPSTSSVTQQLAVSQ